MSKMESAFEQDWYAQRYLESISDTSPFEHYLSTGWRHGHSPGPLFDAKWYGAMNPDVISAGLNPFEHFLLFGWQEDRDPNPLFDLSWYLYQFPGRGDWSPDPMTHYRLDGWRAGRSPHPLFDGDWYLAQFAQSGVEEHPSDPLSHYLDQGWKTGFDPNPLFDSAWYLRQHAAEMEDEENPLAHFIRVGAKHGADPSPRFSTTSYTAKHPHCGGRDNALAHFLEFGRGEAISTVLSESPVRPDHRFNSIEPIGVVPDSKSARSLAIIAGHDDRGSIGLATRHMCAALQRCGVSVVLSYDHKIIGAKVGGPWDAVVTADHDGYDFFSWRLALEQFSDDATFDEVLMLNDSVIGPFSDLEPLLTAWRSLPFDVTGLVESSNPRPHLHSWGLRFAGRCSSPAALLSLYGKASPRMQKADAVDFLEIPLAEFFRTRGCTTGSVFSQVSTSTPTRNPAVFGWNDLLASGMPFIKREVLLLPDSVTGRRRADIRKAIAAEYPGMSSILIGELLDDALAQVGRAPVFN
jgi:hypothetical protein